MIANALYFRGPINQLTMRLNQTLSQTLPFAPESHFGNQNLTPVDR